MSRDKLLATQIAISMLSMLGTVVVGYHRDWIWKFAHLQNVISILYFIFTEQYGFLVGNLFFIVIYFNNQRQWDYQEALRNHK